jgi:hypothetical protein
MFATVGSVRWHPITAETGEPVSTGPGPLLALAAVIASVVALQTAGPLSEANRKTLLVLSFTAVDPQETCGEWPGCFQYTWC